MPVKFPSLHRIPVNPLRLTPLRLLTPLRRLHSAAHLITPQASQQKFLSDHFE